MTGNADLVTECPNFKEFKDASTILETTLHCIYIGIFHAKFSSQALHWHKQNPLCGLLFCNNQLMLCLETHVTLSGILLEDKLLAWHRAFGIGFWGSALLLSTEMQCQRLVEPLEAPVPINCSCWACFEPWTSLCPLPLWLRCSQIWQESLHGDRDYFASINFVALSQSNTDWSDRWLVS